MKYLPILLLTFSYLLCRADIIIDKNTTSGIVELLVSDRQDEIQKGKALLKEKRFSIINELIRGIESEDLKQQAKSAYELALIISPWIRSKESGSRFYQYTGFKSPGRPVKRPTDIPESRKIRDALKTAITSVIGKDNNNQLAYQNTKLLEILCESLGEVADDNTVDWALQQLDKINSPHIGKPLLNFSDSYLGIQPLFSRGGMCGNSSPEEFRSFKVAQEKEFKEAVQ